LGGLSGSSGFRLISFGFFSLFKATMLSSSWQDTLDPSPKWLLFPLRGRIHPSCRLASAEFPMTGGWTSGTDGFAYNLVDNPQRPKSSYKLTII
jgi:hypothetical protein